VTKDQVRAVIEESDAKQSLIAGPDSLVFVDRTPQLMGTLGAIHCGVMLIAWILFTSGSAMPGGLLWGVGACLAVAMGLCVLRACGGRRFVVTEGAIRVENRYPWWTHVVQHLAEPGQVEIRLVRSAKSSWKQLEIITDAVTYRRRVVLPGNVDAGQMTRMLRAYLRSAHETRFDSWPAMREETDPL
jgi:hypothetical protein